MKKTSFLFLLICFLPVNIFAQHQIIRDGFNWLESKQSSQGAWGKQEEIYVRDTSEVLETFRVFSQTGYHWTAGVSWMNTIDVDNNDYLARKIFILKEANIDTAALSNALINAQNSDENGNHQSNDNGWGYTVGRESNILDTVFSLRALGDQTPSLSSVVSLIRGRKELGNGWSFSLQQYNFPSDSKIYPTALTMIVLINSNQVPYNDWTITEARTWLMNKQNTDGGFGEGHHQAQSTKRRFLC